MPNRHISLQSININIWQHIQQGQKMISSSFGVSKTIIRDEEERRPQGKTRKEEVLEIAVGNLLMIEMGTALCNLQCLNTYILFKKARKPKINSDKLYPNPRKIQFLSSCLSPFCWRCFIQKNQSLGNGTWHRATWGTLKICKTAQKWTQEINQEC